MIENSESYKIHIVILTWNNNKILKRCLESIENVDHKNFTISVIDNYSSDDSLKMISNLGSPLPFDIVTGSPFLFVKFCRSFGFTT